MRTIFWATCAALAVILAPLPVEAAEECFADWSKAAPIVREKGLATVEALSRRSRAMLGGDIVKATLCRQEGTYVYRLVLRGEAGTLRNVVLDARDPFGADRASR